MKTIESVEYVQIHFIESEENIIFKYTHENMDRMISKWNSKDFIITEKFVKGDTLYIIMSKVEGDTKPKTIKEICEKYGLKQIELSRRFNIPRRTVQDWYSEKRTPPDYVVGMIDELLKKEKEPEN